MTDQLDIHGNAQPLTWDGEPMYSPETVAEGLFDPEAFEQMPGQISMEAECRECCCCERILPGAPGAGGSPWICNECGGRP